MTEINYKQDQTKENKLFNLIMTIIIAVIILISTIYILILAKNEKNEIETHIGEISTQIVSTINYRISNNFQELDTLAITIKHLKPAQVPIKKFLKILSAEMETNNFTSMGYITPQGIRFPVTKAGKILPSENIMNNRCFKEVLVGNTCIDATQEKENSIRFSYYYPVFNYNKEVIGALSGTNNAQKFIDSMSIPSFNNSAETYILSSNGEYVLSTDSDYNKEKADFIYNKIQNKLVKNKYSEDNSSDKSFVWFRDKNNILKVANFTPIKYNGWSVLLVVPENSLSQSSDKLLSFTIIFFILINSLFYFIIRHNNKIRKEHNKKILQLAFIDDVTEAYTKTKFTIEANKILDKHKIKNNFAMIVMDIDNFKVVNDVYDMLKGNDVLKDIASIIKEKLADRGIFGRLNSDVFSILLKYDKDSEVITFIEEMIASLNIYNLSVKLVPSFGIYYLKEKMQVALMCDRAIIAKQTVKGHVGIRYSIFSEDLREKILNEKAIEGEMHQALENNEFVMYLQPKYDMRTGNPCGSEALVRWIHPEKGLIPPFKFIPLFEKNGFVAQVDKCIWEQAAKTIRKWIDLGITPVPISVNLSRIHFNNPNLVNLITSIVEKYNVPTKYLELEITESAFLANTETMNDTILKLKEKGFEIAMDDFGTGYSSLNMLRSLPVDYLKLDRGFINETVCSERGLTVLKYIVEMAKHLKTKVVSEGIETLEQADLLKNLGCDIAQGFYYAKPMPLNEFEEKVFGNIIKEKTGV